MLKANSPLIGHTCIVRAIVAQARPGDQRGRINPHRTRSCIVRVQRDSERRAPIPTLEMEIYVKTFLLAVLLIIGVVGCAPLTAQQTEAIDYQNHRPWSGG